MLAFSVDAKHSVNDELEMSTTSLFQKTEMQKNTAQRSYMIVEMNLNQE